VLEKKMSRVSILQYTLVLLRIQTTNDFEKIVFLNSKRGEKKKQKTQKTREIQKKKMKFLKSYRYDCAWCSTLSLLSAFFFLALSAALPRTANHRLRGLLLLPSFSRL